MRKIFQNQKATEQIFSQDDNRATKEDINQLSIRIDETVQALSNLAGVLSEYEQQMAESVNTEQLTAVNGAIQTLQATIANLGNVQVQNLEVTVKSTIALLEAVTAEVANLNAEAANITSLLADSATLDEATITTLNATTARISNWVLENISADSIIASTAQFTSVTTDTLTTTDNATIGGSASVGGNLTISGNTSARNATFEKATTVEELVENITWNGKTTITDSDSFVIAVPHFENGQYYIQLRNNNDSYATIELFNSVDNYFARWSQSEFGVITNIDKDGQNENAVIYITIENPSEQSLDLYYASTSASENIPSPSVYREIPVEPLIVYPVTYKDGSKFFKNVDLANQGSSVGTLRQVTSDEYTDATTNVSYDTTEDTTIIVYKPDQSLNTDDTVQFEQVETVFLGLRDLHTKNFVASEMRTLATVDLTAFDDGSVIIIRDNSIAETNAPSGAYIKETEAGVPVLYDIVKTRNMPVVATNKPLIWDPTTKSLVEATDIEVRNATVDNDLFVSKNAVILGDLEVRGTTFSSEVENVQSDGDWIVLRANNPTPLANGDYAGFVFHNYNSLGKDAAITVDNTGTFRVSTQTTESVSSLTNTWLVDEQYFTNNVDFSAATLLNEKNPVTGYNEVFTDIEAYKDSNDDHYFYNPNATTIQYYDNVVYNSVSQKVELAGNIVPFTPGPTDMPHVVHFYTSISFMVPQASDMEAIATRSETSDWDNNEIAMYDKTAEKFVGIGMPTDSGQVLKSVIDDTDPDNPVVSYEWGTGGGTGGAVFHFATYAAAMTAMAIPEGQEGYIPDNSIVIVDDQNGIIKGTVSDNPLVGYHIDNSLLDEDEVGTGHMYATDAYFFENDVLVNFRYVLYGSSVITFLAADGSTVDTYSTFSNIPDVYVKNNWTFRDDIADLIINVYDKLSTDGTTACMGGSYPDGKNYFYGKKPSSITPWGDFTKFYFYDYTEEGKATLKYWNGGVSSYVTPADIRDDFVFERRDA